MTSSHGRSGISIFTFYFFPCRGGMIIHFIRRHFIHLLLVRAFFLTFFVADCVEKRIKRIKCIISDVADK